jgi:hypothetical protein
VKKVVLDDHLLRDVLADELSTSLTRLLTTHDPCTTNLYLLRLCKSIVSARGGQLTGSWTPEQRLALGRKLVTVSSAIEIVPLQLLAMRMAEIADANRVSSLGAEAIAAAEFVQGPLAVWVGDDGLGIRTAAKANRIGYRIIKR